MIKEKGCQIENVTPQRRFAHILSMLDFLYRRESAICTIAPKHMQQSGSSQRTFHKDCWIYHTSWMQSSLAPGHSQQMEARLNILLEPIEGATQEEERFQNNAGYHEAFLKILT